MSKKNEKNEEKKPGVRELVSDILGSDKPNSFFGGLLENINSSTQHMGRSSNSDDEVPIKKLDSEVASYTMSALALSFLGVVGTLAVTIVFDKLDITESVYVWAPVVFTSYVNPQWTYPMRFSVFAPVDPGYLFLGAFLVYFFFDVLVFFHVLGHKKHAVSKNSDYELVFGLGNIMRYSWFLMHNIHFWRIWTDACVLGLVTPAVMIALGVQNVVTVVSSAAIVFFAIGTTSVHETIISMGMMCKEKQQDQRKRQELGYINSAMYETTMLLSWASWCMYFVHLAIAISPFAVFWTAYSKYPVPGLPASYWAMHWLLVLWVVLYVVPLLFGPVFKGSFFGFFSLSFTDFIYKLVPRLMLASIYTCFMVYYGQNTIQQLMVSYYYK